MKLDKPLRPIVSALISPNGDVVNVIFVANATDQEIRVAEKHAKAQGFTLYVQQIGPICRDEASLRAAILAEARS